MAQVMTSVATIAKRMRPGAGQAMPRAAIITWGADPPGPRMTGLEVRDARWWSP